MPDSRLANAAVTRLGLIYLYISVSSSGAALHQCKPVSSYTLVDCMHGGTCLMQRPRHAGLAARSSL